MTDEENLSLLWGNSDDFKDRMEQLDILVRESPDELKRLDVYKDIIDIAQDILGTAWAGYSSIAQSHLPEH